MGVLPEARGVQTITISRQLSYFQHKNEKGTEMTWIAISIPVMVLALAIATVPVIFAMVAESRSSPQPATKRSRPVGAGPPAR